jgi:hypothetical protein
MNKTSWVSILIGMAVVAASTGCQNQPPPEEVRHDSFVPADQPKSLNNLLTAQAAVGARRDATLHPGDFDAEGLNSLGQEKLELMLACEEPANPLVVYLDVPDATLLATARQSVSEYLKTRGLPEAQISVKDGANPGMSYSTVDGIAALHSSAGASSGGGAAPAGAPGAAAAGPAAANSMAAH